MATSLLRCCECSVLHIARIDCDVSFAENVTRENIATIAISMFRKLPYSSQERD